MSEQNVIDTTPATTAGQTAVANATEGVVATQSDADKANAQFAETAIAGALGLRHGFFTGRVPKGQNDHADDILDRMIISRMAKDLANNGIDFDNIERNTNIQGRELLANLTDEAKFNARVDALAARLKEKRKMLAAVNTTRVTLRGGIQCLQFGMAYVNYTGTKKDLQVTMYNAPVKG